MLGDLIRATDGLGDSTVEALTRIAHEFVSLAREVEHEERARIKGEEKARIEQEERARIEQAESMADRGQVAIRSES